MQHQLERQIHAAHFAAGAGLLVAVSGGVDSVVLLHMLCSAASRFDLRLQVAHLDHQIRPESSHDADFVRQLCAEWQIPCFVESCDVPALATTGKLSLEMAGRQARREFLLRKGGEVEAVAIVLAHHRDDQVETFFQRLLRGSGTSGLAAMQARCGLWWRPLLDCRRAEIMAYAEGHQIAWVEDASNKDPIYLRNRLRHHVLPQLREINPQLDERLSELCRQLRADEDYWQRQVAEVLPGLVISSDDGLRLDRQLLLALPEALRGRVLREALRQVRGDLRRLEAVHLRAVTDMLLGERSQAQLDLPGCWVARRYGSLWLRKEAAVALPSYSLSLSVPGELQLPCGRTLRALWRDEVGDESLRVAEFDHAELCGPLRIRSWQAGDRFVPQGMAGSKKLKRYFGDQKIELEERSQVPLLVSGATILWLAGMRRSCHAPAAANSRKILHLELL